MSKKARKAKKLRRTMRREWLKHFPQRDLEISFDNLLAYGVTGVAEDKDGNMRAMTIEEIDDALVRKPLIKKELSFNILEERFLNKK